MAESAVLSTTPAGTAPSPISSSSIHPVRSSPSLETATGFTCAGGAAAFTLDFALELIPDDARQSTPVAAAEYFVVNGVSMQGLAIPPDSVWTVAGKDTSGVTVTSGEVELHALRLPDDTWVIDSGQRCDE